MDIINITLSQGITVKTKSYPFSDLLQKESDRQRAGAVAAVLTDGATLMRITQIYRALIQMRPQFTISYDVASAKVLDAVRGDRTQAPYFHHPVFITFPELAAFVLAARETASIAWNKRNVLDSDPAMYYVGLKCKGTQTIEYTDFDDTAQPLKIARFLEMGRVYGERFIPMSAIPHLFPISEEGWRALLGWKPKAESTPRKPPLSGPVSPVGTLIENGYTPPSPTGARRTATTNVYRGPMRLPGFFKPPRP